MKKTLKYSHIFCIVLAILIANVIPVIIFRDKIKIEAFSIWSILVAIGHIWTGIIACALKHKGNYFELRISSYSFFTSDKNYTYTPEYEREFRASMLVFFAVIPFYIPVICFTSGYSQLGWTFLVFFVPQLIFVVNGMLQTLGDVKKEKLRQAQLEKQRLDQEKSEELGRRK